MTKKIALVLDTPGRNASRSVDVIKRALRKDEYEVSDEANSHTLVKQYDHLSPEQKENAVIIAHSGHSAHVLLDLAARWKIPAVIFSIGGDTACNRTHPEAGWYHCASIHDFSAEDFRGVVQETVERRVKNAAPVEKSR